MLACLPVTPIDLRSDTVTRPTPAMRRAMAEAEVGDDVYGEDPTVNRLQEPRRALLGFEAALWVPSGVMGNEIAIRLLTRPGDEVLAEERSHVVQYELAGMAALSGVMPRVVRSADGLLTPELVRDEPQAARLLPLGCDAGRAREHAQPRRRHRLHRRSARARSSRPAARPGCGCTSTARGSGTPRSRWACRRAALAGGLPTR